MRSYCLMYQKRTALFSDIKKDLYWIVIMALKLTQGVELRNQPCKTTCKGVETAMY